MEGKIRELSIESKLIYQRLKDMKPGDFVTYGELTGIIGTNILTHRHILYTARRMAERNDKITFGIITNEGLKCLDTTGIIATGDSAIKHIHRTSRKAARRFTCVGDLNNLTNDEKIKMNTNISILGALTHITREKTIKKLEAPITQAMQAIPYAKTLDAFK